MTESIHDLWQGQEHIIDSDKGGDSSEVGGSDDNTRGTSNKFNSSNINKIYRINK